MPASYSVVCAIQNLWLAATVEGLGVGWVSFYREDSCARWWVCPTMSARRLAVRRPGRRASRVPDLERHGWRRRSSLAAVLHEERYGQR